MLRIAGSQHDRLLFSLMEQGVRHNIKYRKIESLMEYLGFTPKITGKGKGSGSHRTFRREGIPSITFSPDRNGDLKGYQIDQLRKLVKEHGLWSPPEPKKRTSREARSDMNRYDINLRWNNEYEEWVAIVPELPYIHANGDTCAEAVEIVCQLIEEEVQWRLECGHEPPSPRCDRREFSLDMD